MIRHRNRRGLGPCRWFRAALASAVCALACGVSSTFAVSTIKLTSRVFENPGPAADVVVAINVAPADGVTMMDFTFDYDPARLAPTGVFRTGFTSAFILSSSLTTPGVAEAHLTGGGPLSGSGDVVWVLFDVLAPAGTTTDLTWFAALLNGGGIPSQTQNGTVSVVAAQTSISVPDTAQGGPPTTIVVPISASSLNFCVHGSNNGAPCATGADCPGGNCGATGIDLSLRYDQSILTATSVAKTSITNPMTLTTCLGAMPPCAPGTLNIALFGTAPVRGSGALVNVTFTVAGGIGDRSPLNLVRGGIDEGVMTSSLDDGLVTVCDQLDGDGDGVSGCAGDCDNADPDVRPGAAEICNGTDDDCDGSIDEAAPCTDGNACTTPDACVNGSCVPGGEIDCDDGNQCTDDSCVPATGACAHANTTIPCDDGDACTIGDACSGGSCAGAPAPPPDEIDDSVRVTKSTGTAIVSWTDPPGDYAVYRGTIPSGMAWSYDQSCFAGPTMSTSVPDGADPGTGALFFYLVTRRSACGESIQGRNSQGTPIPASSPCP